MFIAALFITIPPRWKLPRLLINGTTGYINLGIFFHTILYVDENKSTKYTTIWTYKVMSSDKESRHTKCTHYIISDVQSSKTGKTYIHHYKSGQWFPLGEGGSKDCKRSKKNLRFRPR